MLLVWHKDNCVMWLGFLVRKCWSAVLFSFVCLAVCSCLTCPECYWGGGSSDFPWAVPAMAVPPRVGNSVGGSKASERESPICLFGFWTISWVWKFTQLSGGLYTPSSREKDLPQCSLGRGLCAAPPSSQHHRHCDHKTQRFMKLLWSKEGATVQFSLTYCEMDSAVGVTSCRSLELLFYSPCAAYGFPVNPHVGPRSALHLMHSPRGRIEICTWLTI